MADEELEELRKKVKEKEDKEKLEAEKSKLREKLDKGSLTNTAKKVGKGLLKKFME